MTEPYYCFADFEFTCGGGINRYRTELLSVGLIVCDSTYQIVRRYYSTMKPVKYPKLTNLCKRLTNLTQDEINISPDSNTVFQQVDTIMKHYHVKSLFVWGNYDRIGISSDARMHEKNGFAAPFVRKAAARILDIQAELTKKMEMTDAVNIQELSTAFGYTPENGTFHNALNDAEGLYVISRAVNTTDLHANAAFQQLRSERIARREAAKRAAIERRNEITFSVPLSEDAKAFCENADSESAKQALNTFLRMRYAAVKAIKKYPDETHFVLVKINGQMRAYLQRTFRPNGNLQVQWVRPFTVQTLDAVLLGIVREKQPSGATTL